MPRRPLQHLPREITVLVSSAFVIALGWGLVAPVLPQFARSFDVGVAAASFIVSVFAGMRLVFAPASGALITRFGERSTYLTGLIIVALSTGACAFAQSYWQLIVLRGLGGIGSTMFTISAMALLVRLAPPAMRGRVSSAYGSAFLVGNVAGPLLGSALSGLGYRAPFLIYAVALVIAASFVWRFLGAAQLLPSADVTPPPPVTLREALGNSAYRALLASGFANGWSNFGVRIALVPLFAAAMPSIGAGWAGISLTLFALGNVIAITPAGRGVDRHGRKPFIQVGLGVTAASMMAMGWFPNVPMLLVLSVLAGVGTGLLTPGSQAAVADVVGSTRSGGSVLATYQMAGDFGAILGPVLAGWTADLVGFGWAFTLTGAVLGLAAIVWIPARETFVKQHVEAAT